jgi:hypothetical protein
LNSPERPAGLQGYIKGVDKTCHVKVNILFYRRGC